MANWKRSLQLFFAERSRDVPGTPTLEDLCYISGREPRLWLQRELYDELIESVVRLGKIEPESEILEVGCASGFIALGLTKKASRYTGVDIARPALRVARRLGLGNAAFKLADANRLPFQDDSFDAVICYDVITNFPSFEEVAPIITEMLRVVKPGGKALVGSIPDAARQTEYEELVKQVALELDAKFVPLRPHPTAQASNGLLQTIGRWFSNTKPEIICYYFRADDFLALGAQLGCHTQICDIHSRNPYFGYRFNAVYTKPAV